eukprot:TRINITY_DN2541_c0_g1_i4.p3 TRINITY_DN2541_c0_g1~~TRINITY_DN2541_c0_g1_i4.p3  ORF type:complete len:104 (-),score=16.61 TRINITY_DN2541_c0_g1_i4:156-467(-)
MGQRGVEIVVTLTCRGRGRGYIKGESDGKEEGSRESCRRPDKQKGFSERQMEGQREGWAERVGLCKPGRHICRRGKTEQVWDKVVELANTEIVTVAERMELRK